MQGGNCPWWQKSGLRVVHVCCDTTLGPVLKLLGAVVGRT